MDLIPRSAWGARPWKTPNGAIPYAGKPRGVKVHYLGTAYADRPHAQCAGYVRQIQAQHMDGNGWSDLGYSFVVCTHGSVYEGRGLKRRNSANGSTALNEGHYAVCALLGSSGLTRPPDPQLHGIRDAIEHCRSKGPAGSEIRGHRDGYATACPGPQLYAWVQAGAPRPSAAPPPASGPVAGGTYTVRAGDTLIGIAARVPGVSWEEIASANRITDPGRLAVGQRLTIPGALAPKPPPPTAAPVAPREDAMPLRSLYGTTAGHELEVEPGSWRMLTFDRLHETSGGWRTIAPATSVLFGPCAYSATVAVRVRGLVRGQEFQIRLAHFREKEGGGWERSGGMPLSSPVHDGGSLHAVHVWQSHISGARRGRVRVEVQHFGERPVTVDYARAESLFWPGDLA
jgi:LysM repeat protein